MSNGFTDSSGAEIPRNSTRHSAPNHALIEAAEFGNVLQTWMGAAVKDRELFESLGHDARIIVQEAARTFLVDHGADAPLPEDWKARVEAEKPIAMAKYMTRPRG